MAVGILFTLLSHVVAGVAIVQAVQRRRRG